jgi:L-alanine-DL-glutamate epimerase-like enolase superfamily enzyme
MAKDFASLWLGKEALSIDNRMDELHDFTAFNNTIKSAFDMALYDLAAKKAGQPLYQYLGASGKKHLETDITVGMAHADEMARQAAAFKEKGFRIIKIKLGKQPREDIERVKQIRQAVGQDIILRVDANQGWDFDQAAFTLQALAPYGVQFCEQPMRHWNDHLLPALREQSSIKIMADESVFDHHDAQRLISLQGCDYVNIKFAKSGGIREATQINTVCEQQAIPCMMGGMLESRVALSAFAHFALAHDNIIFYDMDTCLLGHQADPVTGGVHYQGYFVVVPDAPGIGADADESFLKGLEKATI